MRKLPVQYVETLALPLGPMASLSANEFFFGRTTRGHSEALATFFPQTGDFSRRRIVGAVLIVARVIFSEIFSILVRDQL